MLLEGSLLIGNIFLILSNSMISYSDLTINRNIVLFPFLSSSSKPLHTAIITHTSVYVKPMRLEG